MIYEYSLIFLNINSEGSPQVGWVGRPEIINYYSPHKHTTAVQAVGLGGFGEAIAPPQKVTQGGCGGREPPGRVVGPPRDY